ncbi:uncharacterized protein LOC125504169, partial [Dendroctonus ponderosae]|uniref:uncharacterized protein LOC125504169 n=1 Tax=Dendroctonus ponderosae TaxID=77166 RepID=UPI002035FBE3
LAAINISERHALLELHITFVFRFTFQIALIFILIFINIHATKPPGFVAPPKDYDPNPPKYEYGYRIQEEKVTQGKDEERDGIYAQGRYYVENGTESNQYVKYFADDWGYHPVVEYSNSSPHSKSSANFAFGEEAIKLKNNEKSIPQDPSDPGKAENLSKLNPSNEQLDPALHLSKDPADAGLNTQLPPADSTYPLQTLILQPQDPAESTEFDRPNQQLFQRPNSLSESNNPLNQILQLGGDPENTIISPQGLPNAPSDPNDQKLQNRHLLVDYKTPTQDLNSKTPVFYLIQTPQVDNFPNIRLTNNPTEAENPLRQLLHAQNNQAQQEETSGKPEDERKLEQLESLPNPEALVGNPDINQPTDNNALSDILFNNDNENLLETAPLVKPPNQIVQVQKSAPSAQYIEFGTRLHPKNPLLNTKKLIDSTRNLVSGDDVLNLNAAISDADSSNDGLESSTLHNLLRQYVSPTILASTSPAPDFSPVESLLNEPIVVADSALDAEAKPVTEKTEENKEQYTSTARNFIASTTPKTSKGVTDNSNQVLVTPRPVSSQFLAPITAGVQLQQVEEQLSEDTRTVETHGKTSVQIQKTIPYYLGMYEYPLGFDILSSGEQNSGQVRSAEDKAVENIELGKTLLYFPEQQSPKAEQLITNSHSEDQTQILNDINSNHLGNQQQENEAQEINQGRGQLLLKINQDQQNVAAEDQLPETLINFEQVGDYQSYREKEAESPAVVTQVVEKPVPYPVEKIVERPVQVPVEITKYVDRPYPVEVRVPYPQPYAVEKVVEHIVKQPYPVEVKVPVQVPVPVEKIVERKVPVPYYIEKPDEKIVEKPIEKIVERKVPYFVERPGAHYLGRPFSVPSNSQGYLLQIPGLFSKQKYSTLVQNAYQPSALQVHYSNLKPPQQPFGHNGLQQYFSYAPENNQYLPPKQNMRINNGRIPTKLKKLNLLVFPRMNIANLPPVTSNPHDLYRTSPQHQSARFSNAQLNNGYLPPFSSPDSNQAEGSSNYAYNVKKPEQPIGLIPPKRPAASDAGKNRLSRSHFDDSSVRMEYGFMPPLIPSLEIDEQGRPIEKDDNKN